MARKHELLYALNAGGVDIEALSRVDLEKLRLAGEHPVSNWFPRILGPMTLRPGLGKCSRIASDAATRPLPFIVNSTDGNQLGFSNNLLTINHAGSPVQVVNSASAITNPTFILGSGGWTDVSDTGDGTDGSATMTVGGQLILLATAWRAAAAEQAVSIAGGDQALAHTIAIVVQRGPVYFRVGTSSGGEQVLTETKLLTGTHKISVTPGAATIYLRFRSDDIRIRLVGSCTFEHTVLGGAGNLTLPTSWATANIPYLSADQSADVLFIGDGVHQPKRIERRASNSWSITNYDSRNGPLQAPSTDKIVLTNNNYHGDGELASNIPYFKTSHLGCLFELTHSEQHAINTSPYDLNGLNQTSDKITVNGLFSSTKTFNDRNWGYNLDFATGSFVGTVVLERSLDADALVWSEVFEFSAGVAATYNDEQSNLLTHWRIRIKAYTSGYLNATLTYLGGSRTGLCRVTDYFSSTRVGVEIIEPFGAIAATSNWRAPVWSDDLGWPKVPRFFDTRLWWFRGDRAYGSIVDDFDNYDDNTLGDSGPVIRSVGAGPVEGAQWALDMQRLIVGTTGYEASLRSSSFDEPITPTKFTARNASTHGSSRVAGVKVDRGLFFVDRTGKRLYEMLYSGETNDYTSTDATRLNPSALSGVVKAMAVQRNPDTRVYMVLDDGTCVVLTWERDDKVYAFTTITTDGAIEDVCVTPGTTQDEVYFVVARTVSGGTQRFIEKLGNERAQISTSTCTLLDAYVEVTGPVSSITGATHLASRTVQVWADGQRRADVLLNSSGNGSLGGTYSRVVYGLGYTAAFKSVKLAYAAQLGTALGQLKRVSQAGVILSNSCVDGLRIGKDAAATVPITKIVNGAVRTANQFFTHYDHELQPVPSNWDADSRIYVSADSAEGPVTVQSIVIDVETSEAVSSPRQG